MEKEMTLRNCLFCGGEALVNKHPLHWVASNWKFEVECVDCDAALKHDTKEYAIKAWNKRVKDD